MDNEGGDSLLVGCFSIVKLMNRYETKREWNQSRKSKDTSTEEAWGVDNKRPFEGFEVQRVKEVLN